MMQRARDPINRWLTAALLASAAALSACGGGGDSGADTGHDPSSPGATHSLSAELSGLRTDRSLLLRINLEGQAAPLERTLTGNGAHTLHTGSADGFGLLVARQPDGQDCSLSLASGTLGAGMAPVQVACADVPYRLGGLLASLPKGIGVSLHNDATGEVITLSATGPFQFKQPLLWGQEFNVTIVGQSGGPLCLITGGNGTMQGDALHLGVSCAEVGGGGAGGGGGGAGGGGGPVPPVPAVPTNLAVGYHLKGYQFNWDPAAYADYYELAEDPDGVGPQPEAPLGGALAATGYKHSLAPQLLHQRLNASYRVRACNLRGCGAWSAPLVPDLTRAIGYFKASNTDAGDLFGRSMTISGDGNTLAVNAARESSKAIGIDGDQADNSVDQSGAVYVFIRSGGTWSQQAYVKASNTDVDDLFGASLALSGDGNTLAVGAPWESSDAIGINGSQGNNSAKSAGAVYVFIRSGSTWSQQAYVKASNTDANDNFGDSVALSTDGNTLAVGADNEDSSATGINGSQANNSASNSGAVYVFTRSGSTWSQQAYVKASNTDANDWFGTRVALSADGTTLAVSAPGEKSNAIGIDGNQADNSAAYAGAVYVFTRSGSTWSQQAYVKASNTEVNDRFGTGLALSGDGDTLAVGSPYESSNATGIDGNQANNSAVNSGAAYVFTRNANTWSQQAYVKASNTGGGDNFGADLALAHNGNTLVVGATEERSNATGIDGNQANNSATGSGAVYVFTRNASAWSQQAYVKASNTGAGDFFSASLSLSADGSTLAVGAAGESSSATGVGGNQADNTADQAGAVYLY